METKLRKLYDDFFEKYGEEKYSDEEFEQMTTRGHLNYLSEYAESFAIHRCAELTEILSYLKELFVKYKIDLEIYNTYIDKAAIEKAVYIRTNWQQVLMNVERVQSLSDVLGYGFSKRDISILAELHKSHKELKDKIEDLLEDCNFHTEARRFSSGNYEPYINECREI